MTYLDLFVWFQCFLVGTSTAFSVNAFRLGDRLLGSLFFVYAFLCAGFTLYLRGLLE